jgi:hypothetical protein
MSFRVNDADPSTRGLGNPRLWSGSVAPLLLVVEAAETTASPPLALDSLSGERVEDMMATVLARRLVASSPGERKAEALETKLMSSARPRACIDARGDNLTVTQPTEYLATGEAVPLSSSTKKGEGDKSARDGRE